MLDAGTSTLRQLNVQPRSFAIASASAKHAWLRASRCGPCFIPASLASKRFRGVMSAVPKYNVNGAAKYLRNIVSSLSSGGNPPRP